MPSAMSTYARDYARAVRYNADEQAAFENAIDAEPTEATNHLVYADWLDEHGHEDEAAFRRMMGRWFQEHEFTSTSPIHNRNSDTNPLSWRIDPYGLPNDIPLAHIRSAFVVTHEPHVAYKWSTTGRLGWDNYRSMEEGLRQAFLKGRNRE